MNTVEIEQLEINLLLEALYQRYGYDFRQYSQASIKRRVTHHLTKTNHDTISALIPHLLYNEEAFKAFLFDISVTVTEMFRDPWFYATLQTEIFPFLKTFPFINIWHAGCATGEEVYSLAILLKENNLYDRAHIYATDFNDRALQKAKSRIYPLERMKDYSANYQKASGKHSLSDYYHAQYDAVIFDSALQKNITFANHNLATDGVFSEMHLILCRNVLIYFNRELQNRVLSVFRDSLCYNGFLCLGSKETLDFSEVRNTFVEVARKERIYQHKG
ncbi:protein-glutamate O-methyltransferase CheR [Anaerolineales bacterium HSG6]|nr:protein-glutamate O-methyltransferase CheR [Anaerolineales bacterium HSG6]MDM8531038.1 protein-glutamate O-methyltransferase CheR [Anaerolineales bacterium HSG25]